MTNFNVTNANLNSYQPNSTNLQQNNTTTPPQTIENTQDDTKKKKIAGAVLAAALSAVVIGGAAAGGKLSKCKKEIARLNSQVTDLSNSNKALTSLNEELSGANKAIEKAKEQIDEILSGDGVAGDIKEKIESKLKLKIDDYKPNYDLMSPPIKEDLTKKLENAVDLPRFIKSGVETPRLDIPEITTSTGFDFTVPTNGKLNVVKGKVGEIIEQSDLPTSLSKEYNDALLNWNDDKIARDILQNFYDGHGQTLDGVKFKYTPIGNGKFKVRISGDSTYTHDNALLFGSTKSGNANAAGNYGEGLKITVLKLLKDKGAENVSVGSQNWCVKYKMNDKLFEGRDVMAYDVRKAKEFVDGSYFEFETDDMGILKSLRNSIDRFYHSNNPDFQNLDFNSDKLGIKILPKGQKGGLYIAGQRFEFNNDYDGLDGFNFIIKQKLPENIVDPSRDRTPLNESDLKRIGYYLGCGLYDDAKLSAEETGELINACERYWKKAGDDAENPLAGFIREFTDTTARWEKDLKYKFPDKYVAYSNATPELIQDLESKGYTVCDENFSKLGMKNIHELMSKGRAHTPIEPNEIQNKKIGIIKEAINAISENLKGEFTDSELDTKIYLFDANSAIEKELNEGTLAEAITENGVSKGFWIDKNYLDKSSFCDVLATAMHEMSHKAGGDESMEFSYKLTDVLAQNLEGALNNNLASTKLKTLDKMWKELGNA